MLDFQRGRHLALRPCTGRRRLCAQPRPARHRQREAPCQRGVFHRSANEQEAGFYINTNKTADINKAENEKGYVIPWAHDAVLYWLEKLRNWQEHYNPIAAPTPWTALERKHLAERRPIPRCWPMRCGLLSVPRSDRWRGRKPLISSALSRIWYKLLVKLEQRCAEQRDTLDNGTPYASSIMTLTRQPSSPCTPCACR